MQARFSVTFSRTSPRGGHCCSGGTLRPRGLQASVSLGMVALTACFANEFPPEPTTDEEGLALVSALELTSTQAECSAEGLYWPQWQGADAPVLTSRGGGTAGVLQGVLATVSHLKDNPFSDDAREAGDLEPWLELLRSGEVWLSDQAVTTESGALYWPQCVASAGVEPDSSCALSGHAGPVRTCDAGLDAPAAGLFSGVAGIGDFYLSLYEQQSVWSESSFASYADESACRWLQTAVATGEWLMAHECQSQGIATGAWPATGTDCASGLLSTGLADGSAGIGYYLLRLHLQTGRTDFLNAAIRASTFLHGLLVSYPDENEAGLLSVPIAAGESNTLTGLYDGNAGVSYFLLALSGVLQDRGLTGQAEATLTDARGILQWLKDDEVRQSSLGGYNWLADAEGVSLTPGQRSVATGLEDGAAGVGWAFLQASRAGESDALDSAQGAGRWLSHALIAHYYQGRVWWPDLIEPWTEPSLEDGSASAGSTAVTGQRYRYMTGLRRGIAGVAWFLLELAQEEDLQCSATLSDQAAHWLYLRGRPQNTSTELWRWPEVAERYVSGDELTGREGASLDYGTMGILPFLSRDRAGDLSRAPTVGYSVFGILRLPLVAPAVSTCYGPSP